MTFEEESIKFLENHIDHSFNSVMQTHTIENLEWLDGEELNYLDREIGDPPEYRAFAHMQDDDSKDDSLIVLFPPFIPTGANN